jgi:hypothetical protein
VKVLTDKGMKCYHTPFHYSIIPGWNKQNVGPVMPYYKQFVEFMIHRGYDAWKSKRCGGFRILKKGG